MNFYYHLVRHTHCMHSHLSKLIITYQKGSLLSLEKHFGVLQYKTDTFSCIWLSEWNKMTHAFWYRTKQASHHSSLNTEYKLEARWYFLFRMLLIYRKLYGIKCYRYSYTIYFITLYYSYTTTVTQENKLIKHDNTKVTKVPFVEVHGKAHTCWFCSETILSPSGLWFWSAHFIIIFS